jgi:hypothetical protein
VTIPATVPQRSEIPEGLIYELPCIHIYIYIYNIKMKAARLNVGKCKQKEDSGLV